MRRTTTILAAFVLMGATIVSAGALASDEGAPAEPSSAGYVCKYDHSPRDGPVACVLAACDEVAHRTPVGPDHCMFPRQPVGWPSRG